jgi:hypothetical protein
MRLPILATSLAILAATGCKETTAPLGPAPTFHLNATISDTGACTVKALDHDYVSNNAQRGDIGTMFVGTLPDLSYHGVGCWVGTASGDGDLIVIFSGNSLGKPLDVGTYALSRQILDNTPAMHANVTFRNSEMLGDKLVTLDGAAGSVTVEATPSGGRVIKADVELTRWRTSVF